jgi:two-component system cell cycle response regulator DivK
MSKTVLIVEDNELNMKLFHDLLEAHGIDTIECNNGLEVLNIARENKPDLILMDIQLPEVSGLDVTRWLKDDAVLKDIPVIAVTAFAMKGDEEKIREGGCEDYISKPISVTRFLDVVQKYLGAVENKVAPQPAPAATPAPAVSEELPSPAEDKAEDKVADAGEVCETASACSLDDKPATGPACDVCTLDDAEGDDDDEETKTDESKE